MNVSELLKEFLQLPELAAMGSTQERAAFIALHIDRLTVREAGQDIGVSKSQVTNLAGLFQTKLATKMMELKRRGRSVSAQYLTLQRELYGQLWALSYESGSNDWDWDGKVGNFKVSAVSREDLAECFGEQSPRFDDE
jgi:hypothetical protein